MALISRHLKEEPVPPSQRTELEVPADLERVVLDCLRKDPGDRPRTAAELAERLAACDTGAWGPEESRQWWQLRFPDGVGAP